MPSLQWDWHPLYAAAHRGMVTREVEAATGQALSAIDPLPDTLIARAQEIGLAPLVLLMWIEEQKRDSDWSSAAMLAWAKAVGAMPGSPALLCAHCGALVDDPEGHVCEGGKSDGDG